VKVKSSLKFFLFSFHFSEGDIDFKIEVSNKIFAPASKIKLLIVSSLLSLFFPVPIISFIIHLGLLHVQSLISTATKSPFLAPLKFFSYTKISFLNTLLSGITKPKSPFLKSNFQIIKPFLLSTIFVIIASFLHLNFLTSASTLSQFKAVPLFFSNTKYPFSLPSTSTNQKPSFSL
jgi:hypothetical protein